MPRPFERVKINRLKADGYLDGFALMVLRIVCSSNTLIPMVFLFIAAT